MAAAETDMSEIRDKNHLRSQVDCIKTFILAIIFTENKEIRCTNAQIEKLNADLSLVNGFPVDSGLDFSKLKVCILFTSTRLS